MLKRIKYFCSLVIVFLAFIFIIQQPAHAQTKEHFYTSLTTTYSVDLSGITRVEHAFEIRNLTPEYYISKYGLTLNSSNVSNIRVITNGQIIDPNITQKNGSTEIEIEFDDKLVGKDKVRRFNITYLNPQIAQVNGQVLEAHIPAMSSEEDYNQHQVILVTPLRFGRPTRISPENYEMKIDNNNITLTYNDIHEQGISAIFGEQQIFSLTLRYHLDNPHNQTAITQVSLPPDTALQKIYYHQLEPRPQTIEQDEDGNWIATYYLPANETIEVNIQADVLISLNPLHPWLNPEPLDSHLSQQPFWETNHEQIQQIAADLNTTEDIYHYVVETLNYTNQDLKQQLERLGAVQALKQPNQATCQEFTDLFIALARAKGIPARRATGYAHSNDPTLQPLSLVTDVLHAWPEYYNQQTQKWIPVDPTWADTMKGVDYFTQFDLKHIVFAYNGNSSKYPLAAGDYKLPNQETKDIQVVFSETFPQVVADFELKLHQRKLFNLIPLPSWYELIVMNHTGQAWHQNQLTLISPNQAIVTRMNDQVFSILPWQEKKLELQVFNLHHWLPKEDTLQLSLQNQDYHYEQTIAVKTIKPIQFKPQEWTEFDFKSEQFLYGVAVFALIAAVTTGSLLVFKRRS
jgi:transglutaminase-like putative cysteine protease